MTFSKADSGSFKSRSRCPDAKHVGKNVIRVDMATSEGPNKFRQVFHSSSQTQIEIVQRVLVKHSFN